MERQRNHPFGLYMEEEHARVRASWERCLASGKVESIDTRIYRPDGKGRWMRLFTRMQRGPTGRAIRAVGLMLDIHEQKQQELALLEAKAQAEAATVAREAEPGTLGANVLLRPVLERSLLPTLTYLAGPGELAYFAQVSPIASALGAPAPVVSPRWAGEVLDGDAYRALDRLGLSEAILRDPHAAEQHVAQRLLDDGISDTLERLRVAIDAQLRALRDSVDGAGARRDPAAGAVARAGAGRRAGRPDPQPHAGTPAPDLEKGRCHHPLHHPRPR